MNKFERLGDSMSALHTTNGAIKIRGISSSRFNELASTMTKHGKWFRLVSIKVVFSRAESH